MISVPCAQCGSINLLAAENCQQCGAELHYVMPAPDASTFGRPASEYAADPGGNYTEFVTDPEIGPFTGVSSVLNPTITLFKDNFWLVTKIVFLIFAPFEIFKALSLPQKDVSPQTLIVTFLLWLLCTSLVSPSLIFALVRVMRTGTGPSVNEAYRFGLSKLGVLVPTMVLSWILIALGFVCLIVPGIILSLAFQIIYPIIALENLSPIEVLKRSYKLTNGHKGNIFVAGLVFALLVGAVNIPVTIAVAMLPETGSLVWLGRAGGALISDILSEANMVLALVIYLSILKSNEPAIARVILPPPPPVFEER